MTAHRHPPIFTAAELAYLTEVHPLARLATVGADGMPHVMPLGMYRIDSRRARS